MFPLSPYTFTRCYFVPIFGKIAYFSTYWALGNSLVGQLLSPIENHCVLSLLTRLFTEFHYALILTFLLKSFSFFFCTTHCFRQTLCLGLTKLRHTTVTSITSGSKTNYWDCFITFDRHQTISSPNKHL